MEEGHGEHEGFCPETPNAFGAGITQISADEKRNESSRKATKGAKENSKGNET
jgi:hypothetical protein